jgi:hypothetical protein
MIKKNNNNKKHQKIIKIEVEPFVVINSGFVIKMESGKEIKIQFI